MCAHPPVYKWGWGHTLHFYLDKYTVKILLHVDIAGWVTLSYFNHECSLSLEKRHPNTTGTSNWLLGVNAVAIDTQPITYARGEIKFNRHK